MASQTVPQVVVPPGGLHPESPRWDPRTGQLMWVDVEAGQLHALDLTTGIDHGWLGSPPLSLAAPARAVGSYVVVQGGRVSYLTAERQSVAIAEVIPDGAASVRLNDGRCDRHGRLWVASISTGKPRQTGTLYSVDGHGRVIEHARDLVTANGIDWNPSGDQMYLADSLPGRIDVFDTDPDTGELHNRRPFCELPRERGFADGLAVDGAGCVWVAMFLGGAVERYNPRGELDLRIELPVAGVTAVCLGGPALDQLYVTTTPAHGGDTNDTSGLAGAVFAIPVDRVGQPEPLFDDTAPRMHQLSPKVQG